MERLITTLLHRLQIFEIDADDLSLQLKSHPQALSIRAITDTLDYFGISNMAVKIPKEALNQLPNHFIAVIEQEGESEVVLVHQKKKHIKVTSENGKSTLLSLEDFDKIWMGTVVVVEAAASDSVNSQSWLNLNHVIPALLLLSVVAVVFLSPSLLSVKLYTLLTAAGLVLSYFITKEGLGIKDALAAKVCGSISKNKDTCSAVINAKQGSFFKNVKLADAPIVFFGALLTGLITVGFNHSILYVLAWSALPIIVLSLYLQAFIIKKWCVLCLAISLVLVSQLAVLQMTFSQWDFSLIYLVKGIFTALLVIFMWSVLKKFWKDSIKLKSTLTQYYSLKRNNDLFFYLFDKSDKLPTAKLKNSLQITFGKPEALVRIDAITNPLCGFCQESFDHYSDLLRLYPNDIQVNYIFAVPNDTQNEAYQITQRIIERYYADPDGAYKALSDWFKHRNTDRWLKEYKTVATGSAFAETVLEAHQQWCVENGIAYTPVTIVNGSRFPTGNYKVSDLQFFIEDFKERVNAQRQPNIALVG